MDTVAGPCHDVALPLAGQPHPDNALSRADQRVGSKALSHDVVNALTTARNYAQLLGHDLTTCPCDAHHDLEALSAIESNLEHAIQLLRRESRPWQPAACDLMALVGEASARVPMERAGDVVVQRSEELTRLGYWDPVAVSRILANLLDNAAKYSRPGTPITVAMATDDAEVEIVVNDHGIGVPEAELEEIFTGHRSAVAQAMAPGQGLGLSSSQRLAEEMGGRLWARSAPEGGLAVHLCLPWPGPA